MSTNKPKKAASGKRPRLPMAALLDLAGRRWALRALWELRGGPLGFRALRDACGGASPTVLSARLALMKQDGLIVLNDAHDYALTQNGSDLAAALANLEGLAQNIYGV